MVTRINQLIAFEYEFNKCELCLQAVFNSPLLDVIKTVLNLPSDLLVKDEKYMMKCYGFALLNNLIFWDSKDQQLIKLKIEEKEFCLMQVIDE